jgi:hypothetical protein
MFNEAPRHEDVSFLIQHHPIKTYLGEKDVLLPPEEEPPVPIS